MGVEFEVWHFGAVDVGVRKIGNLGLALSIIWCAKLNWVTDVYVCGLVEVFFWGGGGLGGFQNCKQCSVPYWASCIGVCIPYREMYTCLCACLWFSWGLKTVNNVVSLFGKLYWQFTLLSFWFLQSTYFATIKIRTVKLPILSKA